MQESSLFRKFGRDLIYLCIIGAMAGWILVDWKRTDVWADSINNDLKMASLIIQDDNLNHQMAGIDDSAAEYPSPQSADYQKRAHWAQKQTADILQENVEHLRKDVLTLRLDQLERAKRTLTSSEIQNLNHSAHALVDTFCLIVDNDPTLSGIIKDALFGAENNYWDNNLIIDLSRTPTFINEVRFRSDVALATVLRYCKSKISPGIICDWGRFLPSISTYSSAIRPGEMYHAEIFISEYSTRPDSLAFKVNGVNLPVKDGIAKFSKRYMTPGEKVFTVETEVKDRKTGKVNTYTKEFSLLVVDSCR